MSKTKQNKINNIHTKLLEEKNNFILMKIPPKSHKIENYNPTIPDNHLNMHASLSDFNLFLKTRPLNEKALNGKSFPLILMVKTGISSIPIHTFTEKKIINKY